MGSNELAVFPEVSDEAVVLQPPPAMRKVCKADAGDSSVTVSSFGAAQFPRGSSRSSCSPTTSPVSSPVGTQEELNVFSIVRRHQRSESTSPLRSLPSALPSGCQLPVHHPAKRASYIAPATRQQIPRYLLNTRSMELHHVTQQALQKRTDEAVAHFQDRTNRATSQKVDAIVVPKTPDRQMRRRHVPTKESGMFVQGSCFGSFPLFVPPSP